ncbi:hypothetical protein K491DRAFT_32257 [Lophiostoma macrostomum CBS 122681]|uniref:Uncharacterized protein n=1 Tax=Lophiostoma macrostomum CBS 122681 TaxID=1314788 RepID=A0A6A6T0F3_9PLEO|nr:hypothetical protein K491DRAFT_32257 [Lophiostoma macrostomum CBS 122681]
MDIAATLTTDETESLGNTTDSLETTTRRLLESGAGSFAHTQSPFETCLRLKNTLDVAERKASTTPSWQNLAVLLRCEYMLYVLNEGTALRHNPFLSHWVETIQRLERSTTPPKSPPTYVPSQTTSVLNLSVIYAVRVGVLKSMLESYSAAGFAQLSPEGIYKEYCEGRWGTSFEARKYIEMLEEEGIYETKPSDARAPAPEPTVEKGKGALTEQAKLNSRQQWKQDILGRLENDRDSAVSELTHLPIELSHLDFLTTLLQDQILQQFSIEPDPVIRDYLQHALRLAEEMGQPPGSVENVSSEGTNGVLMEATDGTDYGRTAQVRAVKLLLLFIRNLIRKALLPPEAIYFEIQEICVRYVWIKEVREFRVFIEEGGAVEQTST